MSSSVIITRSWNGALYDGRKQKKEIYAWRRSSLLPSVCSIQFFSLVCWGVKKNIPLLVLHTTSPTPEVDRCALLLYYLTTILTSLQDLVPLPLHVFHSFSYSRYSSLNIWAFITRSIPLHKQLKLGTCDAASNEREPHVTIQAVWWIVRSSRKWFGKACFSNMK